MSEKRIRLKIDLPVEVRRGCKAGNVYDVLYEVREPPKGTLRGAGRLAKVGFNTASGVVVYALPHEFEWYDDRSI
jgi:hypothetical protein